MYKKNRTERFSFKAIFIMKNIEYSVPDLKLKLYSNLWLLFTRIHGILDSAETDFISIDFSKNLQSVM